MDKDRVKGWVKQVKGAVKEAVGKAVGDAKLEAEGKNDNGRVCAELGYEPPGYQFVSAGGLGKSTIGRVAGTPWRGSPDPTRRIGCRVSCNQTNINLEIVAAFNEMLMFRDPQVRVLLGEPIIS